MLRSHWAPIFFPQIPGLSSVPALAVTTGSKSVSGAPVICSCLYPPQGPSQHRAAHPLCPGNGWPQEISACHHFHIGMNCGPCVIPPRAFACHDASGSRMCFLREGWEVWKWPHTAPSILPVGGTNSLENICSETGPSARTQGSG